MKKSVLFCSALCLVLLPFLALAKSVSGGPGLPDGFVKNEGQVHDAHGSLLKDVLYTTTSSQGTYLFFSDKIMFLPVMETKAALASQGAKAKKALTKATLLQVLFDGAEKNVKVDGLAPLEAAFNYYTKNSERLVTTKMYSKIVYHGLYKGIDLVFYYKDGTCEYDLVAAAGADPSLIRMKFSGQQRIEAEKDGALAIVYKGGKWKHGAPNCFQGKSKVASHYKVAGNTATFSLAKYDVSKPLTIDPVLVHATYFGGSGDEGVSRIKTDASGNLYISALTTSASGMPLTNPGGGAYYQSAYVSGSYYDAYIAKFSPTGTLLWCTYYGDGGEVNGFDMDVSSAGKVVITGATGNSGFPTFDPGGGAYYVGTFSYPAASYVAEFNPSGVRLWATLIGGGGYGDLTSVTYDPSGNIVVAGTANSSFPVVNPGSGAYYQGAVAGTDQLWVGKFNSSRALVWGTFYSGSGFGAYPQCIAADASGNIVVGGTAHSGVFPTYNPGGGAYYQSSVGGGTADGFLVKFSNSGVLLWATYVGGDGDDDIIDCGFDPSGNLYTVGYSSSTNFPVVNSGGGSYYQSARGGSQDAIIQKFSSANVLQHSTYYGTTGTFALYGCQVTSSSLFVAGYTSGTAPLANAFQGTSAGGNEGVVAKFDLAMIMKWASYYGGTGSDGAYCIAAGSGTDVYFGGGTTGGLTLVNNGTYYYDASYNGGGSDGLLVKLNDVPPLPTVTTVNPLAANPGTVVGITGTNFNTVPANNIVYFGATRATVTAATTTSLTVTVPTGSTYMPVSVTNNASSLTASSLLPFLPTYNNSLFVAGKVNFALKADIATSVNPEAVALGDLDGDGMADIVVADVTSGNVSIYRNTSTSGSLTSGSFSTKVDLTTGMYTNIVVIQDVDGDGKRDIVTSSYGAGTVSIFRNISTSGSLTSSSFAARVDITGVSGPMGVAFGDLDADGKPDMIVVSENSSAISVFKNIATSGAITTGSFAAKVDFSTGTDPRCATIADIDGDGKPEILVTNNGANSVSVFQNTATSGIINTGSFAAKVDFATNGQPYIAVAGDINGDGKPDIAVSSQNTATISVLQNTSTSGVINTSSFGSKVDFSIGSGAFFIAAGDIDGDSKPDLVSANFGATSVSVLRNTGIGGTITSGSFAQKVDFTTGNSPFGVAVGDLDGDGKPDLAVSNYGDNTISLIRNNPLRPITGAGSLCAAANITLSDLTTGGTWSSSNTAVGTVGSATGIATGIAAGTALITYAGTAIAGFAGNIVTAIITVNAIPSSTGATNSSPVCNGNTVTLSDHSTNATGWLWSGSNGSSSTLQSPVMSPTTTTTYSLTVTNSNGCINNTIYTTIVTVNVVPSSTGATNTSPVCNGNSVTLSDHSTNATGWSWNGSDGSSSTLQSPAMTPTATTTYSLTVSNSNGCINNTVYTTIVTVNVVPSSTGATNSSPVCNGNNAALSDNSTNATGWLWSGSDGSSSTLQSPAMTPTATTTYSLTVSNSNGCINNTVYTTIVTVNVVPSSTGATNSSPVCNGSSVTLSDHSTNATGWSWSGSDGSSSASQSPVMSPTATTTYSLTVSNSNGCINNTVYTTIVTVNAVPSSTGATNSSPVCNGDNVTLYDNSTNATGWSWNGSDGSSSALQSPVMTPTATTTYSLTVSNSNGCTSNTVYATIVTVNVVPSSTGATNGSPVCNGDNVALYDNSTNATGWSWNGSDGSSSASQSPVMSPTATTTYSLTVSNTDGCVNATAYTTVVTVNSLPAAGTITGTGSVCVAAATNLTDAAAGGVWSSSAPAVGTVSTSGVVTGIAAGTTRISYTVTNGCGIARATSVVTVNTTVTGTITGPAVVAVGGDITLSDAVSGGAWSASNAHATVIAGLVHGVSSGTVAISYTVTDACGTAAATKLVTVGTTTVSVAAITGYNFYLCQNATAPYFDATPGGVWSIDPAGASVASVSATGIVTGLSAGTAMLSYSVGASSATHVLTVYPVPAAITGTPSACQGFTTALTDVTPGGVWSSGIPSTATVGTSGIVSATNAGTVPIYYTLTLPAGCRSAVMVTINPNPAGIAGASSVCIGSSVALSDVTAGGSWSTPSSFISVSGSGSVTGLSVGTGTISYTLATGCYRVFNVTVKATPAAITGNTTVCSGATTALTDATAGGLSWSSSTASVATVTAAGVVSGVAAGTSSITYTLTSGCTAVTTVSVTAQPAAITNNAAFCQGSSITLSDATGGGTWTSSNLAVGTVDPSSGAVAGIAPGSATITYALAGSGCRATAVITVNASTSAGSISGTQTVCAGSTTPLSSASVPGGAWSSTATTIATVNAFGVVSGLTAGTTTISYTITNICGTTASSVVVTVNPLPVAGTITGTGTVCAGSTTSLTDASAGGVWTTSNALVATVGSDGTVTGVAGGTARITYAVTNSCGNSIATSIVTVNALTAGTISGASSVIAGLTITLSDAVMGGVWSASNANATVSSVGVVTGVTAGTVTISYTVTNGCGTIAATQLVTVSASSTSGILGTLSVCNGMTTALTDLTPGGTWHSSNTLVATVGTSGIVTGAASGTGTATISYTVGGVPATVVVTLNPNPSGIGGATSVCNGSSVTMSDFTVGGTWTSTAGVSVTTGTTLTTVTGLTNGLNTVTYSLATGCYRTFNIMVNAAPTAVLGNLYVCVGTVSHLSDATGGGVSWTSSTPAVATINASGNVTGVSPGTSNVTYTITTGCKATATVTVHTCPAAPGHEGSTIGGTDIVQDGTAVELDGNGEVTTVVNEWEAASQLLEVRLVPNPNNGTFTLSGTTGAGTNDAIALEITNMLGQVIYAEQATVTGGRFNERIQLDNNLANGIYLLNIKSRAGSKVMHFVVEK